MLTICELLRTGRPRGCLVMRDKYFICSVCCRLIYLLLTSVNGTAQTHGAGSIFDNQVTVKCPCLLKAYISLQRPASIPHKSTSPGRKSTHAHTHTARGEMFTWPSLLSYHVNRGPAGAKSAPPKATPDGKDNFQSFLVNVSSFEHITRSRPLQLYYNITKDRPSPPKRFRGCSVRQT